MTPDEVLAACEKAGVRLVRFLYCDNGGTIRGKTTTVERLAERMRTGIGLTVAMSAMNSLDQLQPVAGLGPVGEVRLVPDPGTFTVLPYAPRSAAMLCDHVGLDGEPDAVGPRHFLRRMAAQLGQEGLELRAAVENEFALARPVGGGGYVPIDESLCFSTVGMGAAAEVTDALVDALATQRIELEQYYPELGWGQQEVSVSPRAVLAAADTQVLVRETIRAVAGNLGLAASLAPKPWPEAAGNGAHIHFSAWDGERNAFHDPARRFGLSERAEQFVAGVLAHAPALLALTAPSVNSYRRLQPRSWSSAYACWGPDNREATVRVPSTFWGAEEASTNLEFKPTDASANPYLAFGGLVAAGLDGLRQKLEPPAPIAVDPADLSEEERQAAGAARYPQTLGDALDALEGDWVLRDALGEPLTRAYLAVRRSEVVAYAAHDDDFEFRHHFLKY
ncbi:MAG: glutamine synthetase family protein [Acidimicrobiia bacterium]